MGPPTLGFVGVLYGFVECLGLVDVCVDSTADMSTVFVYKSSLQTDELFQKVYETRVTLFNRGCIGQVLQLHQDCTWTLSPIEKASGSLHNVTKDYMALRHIIL